jgi:hypothetical protein
MITNAMIKTPRDTPVKPSRKVSQSHFLMAMDTAASAWKSFLGSATFEAGHAVAVKPVQRASPA